MKIMLSKALIFSVIVLFVGAGVVPSISSDVEPSFKVTKENGGNIGSCNFDTATFYPTDDSYVASQAPSQNLGYCPYFAIRNGGSGNNWADHPVIKFDISTIPSETDIVSASLNIFYRDYADNSPSGRELTLYRLKADWNEDTITWDNMPIHHNEMTSSIYAPNSPSIWMQWDVTGDVQDFIPGQTTNYGWIIKDEQYWGSSGIPLMYCNSKEYGANIPYLEIETNEPPVADFDYMPLNPQSNIQINFTDLSYDLDGYIESWYWEFGDGYSSTLQNPSHTYGSSGIYSITLEVTDNDSGITTVSKLALVDYDLLSITNLSLNWNFASSPYNLTLHKNELFIRYGSYYYNWTQATTNINPTGEPLINPFIFGWDRQNQTYLFTDWLKPGYGYWLFTYHYCDIYIAEFDPYDDNYITNLEQGWNIVGVPHDQSVDKTNILVDDVLWDTAVGNGWISDFVFGWSRTGQSYNFADTFMPGYAYWMYAYQPCTLKRL